MFERMCLNVDCLYNMNRWLADNSVKITKNNQIVSFLVVWNKWKSKKIMWRVTYISAGSMESVQQECLPALCRTYTSDTK